MDYLIHNAIRDRHNRTIRAQSSTHRGMKQYLFPEQLRLVRNRPVLISEEKLQAHRAELTEKVRAGLVYITLGNLVPFDIEKMAPVAALPKQVPPNFLLDSINRDKNTGLPMNQYGDKPPPETFAMPVPPPAAAVDNPLPSIAGVDLGDESKPPQKAESPLPFLEKPITGFSESAKASLDTKAKGSDPHRKKDRR